MITKIVEVTNGFNWGKFLVQQFDDEWAYRSAVDVERVELPEGVTLGPAAVIDGPPLLRARGWTPEHVMVFDLETGEGALFRHGGLASYDLTKHRIWVCPMFEPFLTWLYDQDVSDLAALPAVVELTEEQAPSALYGYRRPGPG